MSSDGQVRQPRALPCAGMDVFPPMKACTLALDLQGKVLRADAGALDSAAMSQLIGADLVRLLENVPCSSPDIPATMCRGVREVLEGRRSFFAHEYSSGAGQGQMLRVSAVRLEGAGPAHVIFTHTDITESRRLEDALQFTQFAIDHSADTTLRVEENGQFPDTRVSAPVAPASKPGSTRGCENILLLDDDRTVRMVTSRLLQNHGYRVFEALTEQEALEIGSDPVRSVDLLLTDVFLPNISGVEVARRLKSLRPSLKVLLISGYTDKNLGESGSIPDGMGFLQKPFTLDEVSRKVREVLDAPTLREVIS